MKCQWKGVFFYMIGSLDCSIFNPKSKVKKNTSKNSFRMQDHGHIICLWEGQTGMLLDLCYNKSWGSKVFHVFYQILSVYSYLGQWGHYLFFCLFPALFTYSNLPRPCYTCVFMFNLSVIFRGTVGDLRKIKWGRQHSFNSVLLAPVAQWLVHTYVLVSSIT